jgi:sialate O-acetylesterase
VVLTLDQAMQPCAVKYFELADEKGVFSNVEAVASGSQIVITSPISGPTAVRYARKDNPLGVNAYGVNGLPLSPFEIRLK